MGVTPQRSLTVNFSIPYDHSYVDLTMNKEKTAGIESMKDLDSVDVVIAVRTGTTAALAASKAFPKAQLRMFNDEAPAVEEVLSGRAHAFVSSAPLPSMETLKHMDRLTQKFPVTINRQPIAFAVPKGDPDSLNVFDSWIRMVEEEGWLQERRDYWFKSDSWQSMIK
jgi:polar amino acid transport system substrate-binding protein